jgi:hypothetical protein
MEFTYSKRLDLDGSFYLSVLTDDKGVPNFMGCIHTWDESDKFEEIDNEDLIWEMIGCKKVRDLPTDIIKILYDVSDEDIERILALINEAHRIGMLDFIKVKRNRF